MSSNIPTPVQQVLARWQAPGVARHLTCRHVMPARDPNSAPLPRDLDPRLAAVLREHGVERLYAHQHQSLEASRAGKDMVISTPTASGKSLCYNLPVLEAMLADPAARALYLFPTKALARDQVEAVRALTRGLGDEIGVAVYDGDTPPDQRRAARDRGRIIATNPDMLHHGLLPHHPSWAQFLGGLTHVVVDELHTYRGVFGGHVANVLYRLRRASHFHGAEPRFIATSATIANPAELAENLFGRPARLISRSGAPRGERHFLIYNPPMQDPALGLRESYLKAACRVTCDLVSAGVGTLVFCRSRLAVEVMVRQLRDHLERLEPADGSFDPRRVRGYRGGYLPDRRREVEVALRQGDTDVVVATSALELGIDIGSLDAVVLAGWPGSRAAAWQRAGRAGRRLDPSLAVLVSSSEPTDQFVAGQPDYLLGQAPEHARLNPQNPAILVPQLKCAAAELPFADDEGYGPLSAEAASGVMDVLAEAGLLHRGPHSYHYVGHPYPAGDLSLRGPLDENFLVVREPDGEILAEVDYEDVPNVLHEQAIYQLEGSLYQVLRLDHETCRAHVTPAKVNYFTDALTHTRVRVLERQEGDGAACMGEVHVLQRVVGFKKIRLHTHENLGFGDVNAPEREKHTTGIWLQAPAGAIPERHAAAEVAEAALGAATALHASANLLLMSDGQDLGRAVGDARSDWFAVSGRRHRGPYTTPDDGSDLLGPMVPTIFLFDRYPGGTGLAERLYEERHRLLTSARAAVARCPCARGCPACVGPGASRGAKSLAVTLLAALHAACSTAPSPTHMAAAAP